MAELSALQPLIADKNSKKKGILQTLAKWMLKFLMYAIFVAWIAAIFFSPTEIVRSLLSKWIKLTQGIIGITGSLFLGFSAPILVLAILGFIYVASLSRDNVKENNYKFPRYHLSTIPVFVDGPFGIVSAAELIGILLFTAYVFWSVIAYALQDHNLIAKISVTFRDKRPKTAHPSSIYLALILVKSSSATPTKMQSPPCYPIPDTTVAMLLQLT